MMKFTMFIAVIAMTTTTLVFGRPQVHGGNGPVEGGHDKVTIIERTHTDDGKGTFQWSYKLSDGTEVEQSGHTVPPPDGSSDAIVVITGSYKYPVPDGTFISRSYIGDQNGFQITGDDIPGSPNKKSSDGSSVIEPRSGPVETETGNKKPATPAPVSSTTAAAPAAPAEASAAPAPNSSEAPNEAESTTVTAQPA